MFGFGFVQEARALLTRMMGSHVELPRVNTDSVEGCRALQDFIIEKAVSGELTFLDYRSITHVSIDTHYVCQQANIRIRIDDGGGMGSYSFMWVNGEDFSYYTYSRGFDLGRVVHACIHGVDRGETNYQVADLWHC